MHLKFVRKGSRAKHEMSYFLEGMRQDRDLALTLVLEAELDTWPS